MLDNRSCDLIRSTLNNRSCDLMRETLNASEEERTLCYTNSIDCLTLNIFTPNAFARNTIDFAYL